MKTQLDFLKEAISLAEQNPTLKIHIASSDEHCEDKSWTQHRIANVEKTNYCCIGEEIFTSIDDVVDYFDCLGEELTDEQAQEKMEEVILIYTNA